MMIQIRPYQDKDSMGIAALENESGFSIASYIEKGFLVFVVEDNKHIVGCCVYARINDTQAEVTCIYIRREDRGFKLGDGLIRGVLNHLSHLRTKTVFMKSSAATNGFYLKEGFDVHYHESDKQLMTFVVALPEFFEKGCKSKH